MILIVAMPVVAGATVWTGKGDGDQPTMVGPVLTSTLISPLTTPLVIELLSPLLSGGYASSLAASVHTAGGGFTFVGVVLPCAAGILIRLAGPDVRQRQWRPRLLRRSATPAAAGRRAGRGGTGLPAVVRDRSLRGAAAAAGPARRSLAHPRLRHEQQQRQRRTDHGRAPGQTTPTAPGPRLRPAPEDSRQPSRTGRAFHGVAFYCLEPRGRRSWPWHIPRTCDIQPRGRNGVGPSRGRLAVPARRAGSQVRASARHG